MSDPIAHGAAASLTQRVAEFAAATRYADLPHEVVQHAKKAMLDTLGAALAGTRAQGSGIVRRYIAELGSPAGMATIVGTAMRVLPRWAALANGTAMHADSADDTFHPSRVHPSSPVLAAVLADAEGRGASGRDVLAAFAVGTEVTCKVSVAIDTEHYRRGYHATSTCGVFGATAGLCNLRRLSVSATLSALAIAGAESAGLRENFGTMTKSLHVGRAAESALLAASLAELGMTGSPTILEGARGFFQAGGGGFDPSWLTDKIGNPWSYVSPGVSVRAFPSGNLTHPAMDKLRELVIERDIRPQQVKRIAVKTNRLMPVNLTYHRPTTGLQGKLSMEFCLAAILTMRRAGLAEFTDAVVNRPDIREAIGKIEYDTYSDAEAAERGYAFLTTFLDVEMNDGRRYSARADTSRGSSAMPMSAPEVADKVRECGEYAGWLPERTNELIERVLGIEALGDTRELTALLGAAASCAGKYC